MQAVLLLLLRTSISEGNLLASDGRKAGHVRQFRRLFPVELGIGPKRYARFARLRRLLSKAYSSAPWANLAVDAGFCDQALLIAPDKRLQAVLGSNAT